MVVIQQLKQGRVPPSQCAVAMRTALQRAGRVHVRKDGDQIWVGGDVVEVIRGQLRL